MIKNIVLYCIGYVSIRILCQNYRRNEAIAAYIISMISCWKFIIDNDYSLLEAYYWYDIIISILKRDMLMVAHHFLVIYVLYRTNTPDHHIGLLILKYAKISDITAHINKILQSIEVNTNLIKDIRLISLLITIMLWLIFRLGYIIYVYNYVVLYESKIMLIVFTMFTAWWIYKLMCIAHRLAYYE